MNDLSDCCEQKSSAVALHCAEPVAELMLGNPNPEAHMESFLDLRDYLPGYPDRASFDALIDAKLKALEWMIYLKIATVATWLIIVGTFFYALVPPAHR